MCKLSIVRRVKRGHVKIMEDEYVEKKIKKANYYKREKIRGSGQQIYIGEYRTTWSEKKIILIDGCRRKEK
jgi:hypothetical protein